MIDNIISAMSSNESDEILREKYGFDDNRDWQLSKARKQLTNLTDKHLYISQVQYRPFDVRWTFFHKSLVTYPRPLLQKSVHNRHNYLLCLGKAGNTQGDNEWNIVYSSPMPTDINIIPRGGAYLFPLYLYDDTGVASYNLSEDIIKDFESCIGRKLIKIDSKEKEEGFFNATDLFGYIYAVLHSTIYRTVYHECLQDGFPTIPYPKDADYFFNMAKMGCQLAMIHQLEGICEDDIITTYPEYISTNNNLVTKKEFEKYGNGKGRVWINDHQYFDDVPEDAWQLFVSGYRPLEKWLDDRKNKILTSEEIIHYQLIVVALCKQITLMSDIDKMIDLEIQIQTDI